MLTYTPPLKDMQFVLEDLLDAPAALAALPAFADVDAALMQQVTVEAGRFAAEILQPLNATGDRAGCRFEDGAVTTPPGFADAYRQFCQAGWPALACAPELGGQGLPQVLNCALYEMLSAANHGWRMYPGLAGARSGLLGQQASYRILLFYICAARGVPAARHHRRMPAGRRQPQCLSIRPDRPCRAISLNSSHRPSKRPDSCPT